MIIDMHTHAFPARIAARAIHTLKQQMREAQREQGVPGREYIAYTDGTIYSLLNVMDECGIDIGVVLPIATKESQTDSINEYAQAISGDRIISFGSLYPYQRDWENILEELAYKGFKGIKLHPEFQGFNADDPVSIRILKKAEKLGLITVLHAGIDLGYIGPVRCTPKMLYNVLQEVNGDKIIAAHMGAYGMWDELEEYVVGSPIILDTAYVAGRIEKEQYRRIIRNHGVDKIVFGSDVPWEYPGDTIKYLEEVKLNPEELELIKHKNAEKILALSK